MSIGFLNSDSPSAPPVVRPAAPGSALFTFDDGCALSFAEGGHHTLVTGATGSGKTTCFILPALGNLLTAGFSGLVIDIKGNMIDHTLALARACGREQDVIEFGNGPQARPLNLLTGLGPQEVYELFKTLVDNYYSGDSNNKDFHLSGVRNATDLVMMLSHLAISSPRYRPNLAFIAELLTDLPLSARLFNNFKSQAGSLADQKAVDILIKRVEADCFHPCRWVSKKANEDYDNQVEWRNYILRSALTGLLETPGVGRAFCAPEGEALDITDLIYNQKKIVILRFSPEAGNAGAFLARYFLEKYYAAVYSRGLRLPSGLYTYVVADEFQDFADLNPDNRFNDNSFTARSREFHNILIVGAQSVSALGNRGGHRRQAEAFVNNCNNRVMLYSDDPWTQEIADRHKEALLTELQPGEAVVIKFEEHSRRHSHSRKFLQTAHDAGQSVLRSFAGAVQPLQPEAGFAPPSLGDIMPQKLDEANKSLQLFAKSPRLVGNTFYPELEIPAGLPRLGAASDRPSARPWRPSQRPRPLDKNLRDSRTNQWRFRDSHCEMKNDLTTSWRRLRATAHRVGRLKSIENLKLSLNDLQLAMDDLTGHLNELPSERNSQILKDNA